MTHHASKESTEHGGAAFYWVSDEPLCRYLGVHPTEKKFEPAHYTKDVSLPSAWAHSALYNELMCMRLHVSSREQTHEGSRIVKAVALSSNV